MPQTEYGIIDFFTDCIQIGHVSIQVLGNAMRLYNPYSSNGKSIVHLGQIGRHNDVVRIYYQYHVVSIPIQIFKGNFQGFGIGAFLKINLKQFYGK